HQRKSLKNYCCDKNLNLPIMQQDNFKIYEAKGQITLLELYSMDNRLPVTKGTYLRILHGLLAKGLVKFPGCSSTMRESRQ
ncbi:hypothetical protein, partial [Sediminibacterium sp. Gen4]|uniref:hypothetical protein n=2 Tax=unclassified Sediminibacterium TaxID=2635961 RepID=UPI0026209A43